MCEVLYNLCETRNLIFFGSSLFLSSESDGGSGDDTGGHGHGEGTWGGGDLVGLCSSSTFSIFSWSWSGEPVCDFSIDLPFGIFGEFGLLFSVVGCASTTDGVFGIVSGAVCPYLFSVLVPGFCGIRSCYSQIRSRTLPIGNIFVFCTWTGNRPVDCSFRVSNISNFSNIGSPFEPSFCLWSLIFFKWLS